MRTIFDEVSLRIKSEMLQNMLHSYYKKHYFSYETPMTMTFLITNRCPLNCKHCFNNEFNEEGRELTLEEYEILTRKLGNISSALLCGGEPFVRNDFADIVNLLRKNCNLQYCSASTNGIFTDNILSQIEKIMLKYPNRRFVLNFSLDGFEEEHDLIRGKGVYRHCISTIKKCCLLRDKYSNFQIGIVSTMNTINESNLHVFFKYISEEIKPNVISLLLIRQCPRGGEQLKEIQKNNYDKAKDVLYELFKEGKNGDYNSPLSFFPFGFYESISKTLEKGKRNFYCYAGMHGAYIDYDGTVNVCEIMGDKRCSDNPINMGNLRDFEMDFKALWNSEKAMKVRTFVNYHDCCRTCTHETEGLLPSIYFEPNAHLYMAKMKGFINESKKNEICE